MTHRWFLTVFPGSYRNQTYFSERDLAERFVMHVVEVKGIWGKVIEVEPVKQRKTKQCENQRSR
jgi:hypothetical protein